ncbi:unnamed protein product, partial [Fusarium langsethiae]
MSDLNIESRVISTMNANRKKPKLSIRHLAKQFGTGIDVAGIIDVIHLEAPFSIIDYAQEAGRAGRTGEPVTAEVIIEDKDWPDEDAAGEACLDISVREVRRLIRTRGCRRRLLGQCLDGDLRDCKDLGGGDGNNEAKVTRCDNCHHAELAWKSELSAQG